jgi:hypothetical protein
MERAEIDTVKDVLRKDGRMIFAYIYGSYVEGDNFGDVASSSLRIVSFATDPSIQRRVVCFSNDKPKQPKQPK